MASRVLHSIRPALRASGSRLAYASRSSSTPKIRAARRGMASGAHAHETKPDTPWIIGSALLFGPALVYLLGPARSKSTGHGDPHADSHPSGHGSAPGPLMQKVNSTDQTQGGKEDAAGEGQEEGASKEGSDQDDAPAEESSGEGDDSDASKSAKEDTGSSSGGEQESQKPSADEVNDSVKQSVKSDAPKTAKAEEEQQSK